MPDCGLPFSVLPACSQDQKTCRRARRKKGLPNDHDVCKIYTIDSEIEALLKLSINIGGTTIIEAADGSHSC